MAPTANGDCLTCVPFVSLARNNENSSQKAAALVYSVILLPIAQGIHTHRTKAAELLNFDVFGSGALHGGL